MEQHNLSLNREQTIYLKRHFKRYRQVAELVSMVPSKYLLDVGCGTGLFLLMLQRDGVGLSRPHDIAACRNRGLEAYPIDLEEDAFPFSNESFHVVTCLEVLEHLHNPNVMLREIRRVLKKDGTLFVSTPNSKMVTWKLRNIAFSFPVLTRLYIGKSVDVSDVKNYSVNDLLAVLTNCNFRVEKIVFQSIMFPQDDLLAIAH